ncbi:histamine N-methyltransferase-like [Glandiceps talaboti]
MASSSWHKSLTTDRDWYSRAFMSYCSHTDRVEKALLYCTDILPPTITEHYSNNRKTVEEAGPVFRYLGIGSGTGLCDIQLLKELRKSVPVIQATIVDPSQYLLKAFQQSITAQATGLEGVTFDFKVMTIQEFQRDWDGEGFDCVIALNVLYYVPDYDEVIGWIYSYLAENGTTVIQQTAADNAFMGFYATFDSIFTEKMKSVHQDVIEECLKTSGAKSVRTLTVKADIDLTECFDESSECGSLLLDFVTHTIEFRKTAPPTLFKEALEKLSCNGIGVERQGTSITILILLSQENSLFVAGDTVEMSSSYTVTAACLPSSASSIPLQVEL